MGQRQETRERDGKRETVGHEGKIMKAVGQRIEIRQMGVGVEGDLVRP